MKEYKTKCEACGETLDTVMVIGNAIVCDRCSCDLNMEIAKCHRQHRQVNARDLAIKIFFRKNAESI